MYDTTTAPGSSSAAVQEYISRTFSFDYLHTFSNGVFPPSPVVNATSADVGVKISEIAGKGSMSGINPTTAKVWWSTDGGTN